MKARIAKVIYLTLVGLSLVTAAHAGISLVINQGQFDKEQNEIVLNGVNFDAFGQPTITVGDTLLSECQVLSTEIKCSISGTPAVAGGTWKVKVSAGNSPHMNAEIDVFNSDGIVTNVCMPGDYVECYSGGAETRNVGECKTGYRTCGSNGNWSDCQNEALPQAEDCFSLADEDCDGLGGITDPDCANVCGGLTACMDGCFDLVTDNSNCGVCGHVCSLGTTCQGGVCAAICSGGSVMCGGTCADIQSDEYNCGRCGYVCGAGYSCVYGACQLDCPAGTTACAGACRDLRIDVANCGACGKVCAPIPNGTTTCLAGMCGIGNCYAGYANCNNIAVDGCEINLLTDSRNCGMCGKACAAGSSCNAGVCVP